jgi:hypothetical protein
MKETRKGLLRGVGILAALLLAAGAISPAFSAAPLTKAKVKKLAGKQVKKLGPELFIEEQTELFRYGPLTLNPGGSSPVAAFGPFSFTANCAVDDDAMAGNDPDPLDADVLIDTSEDNASFDSDDDSEDDFDAADPAEEWAQETGNDPDSLNEQDINVEDDEDAHALSASGTALTGGTTIRVGSAGDADSGCTFAGWFIVEAPA